MTQQPGYILSFIGSIDCQEVTYLFDNQPFTTAYFVQALLQKYPGYIPLVVMTEEAQKVHAVALHKLLPFQLLSVPLGHQEADLWQTFDVITDAVPSGVRLVVDVTLAYRWQNMLALAASMYLRTAKNVTVERILYGAFYAQTNEGICPTFDMTPFLEFMDWSVATQQFLKYGNALPLRDALKQVQGNGLASGAGLQGLAGNLAQLSDSLAMMRLGEALEHAQELPEHLEQAKGDAHHLVEARPLEHLLTTISDKFEPLARTKGNIQSPDGLRALAHMVRDYLQTENYAQAIMLAREAIVTRVCFDNNPSRVQNRKDAEVYLYDLVESQRERRPLGAWENELADLWFKVSSLRNDISHAGFRHNPIGSRKATQTVIKYCLQVAVWLDVEASSGK